MARQIDEAKPYLVAVAADAASSRRDEVLRGLRRLEVQTCDQLELEIELDGHMPRWVDAASFIASRQEQEGSVRRNIGTAHLKVGPTTGRPHWYMLGRQLAQFLGAPTQGDAFGLLLAGGKDDRLNYFADRRIPGAVVDQARIDLDLPFHSDELEGLLELQTVIEEPAHSWKPVPPPPSSESQTSPEQPMPVARSVVVPPVLPPLDLESVDTMDAPQEALLGPARSGDRGGSGSGPAGPIDPAWQTQVQRLVGQRGEEAVYAAERKRLLRLGLDPDMVVWHSRSYPFAAYDFESLDADGQRIYIEVKATTSSDPTDAFEISEAELLWALRHRSRYYIYRVCEAHTRRPWPIVRYGDPLGRIQDERARLQLKSARLEFADRPKEEPRQTRLVS